MVPSLRPFPLFPARTACVRPWLTAALLAASALVTRAAEDPTTPGPFFETSQPFYQTQVELPGDHFVVRGILLPLSSGHVVLFDQELLRVAAIWQAPAGQPPISLRTMAQISYARPRAKVGSDHPQPTAPALLTTPMLPGVAYDVAALRVDPRAPNRVGDKGRGPLPSDLARFEGIELAGNTAILRYRVGQTLVREWFTTRGTGETAQLLRHLEVAPHATPLHFTVGRSKGGWQLSSPREATAATDDNRSVLVSANTEAIAFTLDEGQLTATAQPSEQAQRFTLLLLAEATTPVAPSASATPPTPAPASALRWPGSVATAAQLNKVRHNGWALDQVPVPEINPWKRRIRPADLAFLSADEAAVITYDGDVWKVTGLADPALGRLTWRRFAAGLAEPLAIAAPQPGVIQAWTKNGVYRLRDTDANGEADSFENFNDQVIQSQSTRSFPLDMGIGPDGSTYVSQGGIVDGSGIMSGGAGTPHAGAVIRISPDGKSSEVFISSAREPFLAVNPRTGVVTGSDQQGHFIPASVSYLFRSGDSFGFPEKAPAKVTPPLVWIPHAQDTSSTSEVWTPDSGFGAWSDRLLHLSYGRGRLFLISPDLDAPVPQGAAVPLGLETDLPLLHARVPVGGGAVWVAGFQIWGTRTKTMWALGRLRPDPESPIVTPVAARSVEHGVVLEFARKLDPASVIPEAVRSRAWNYRRSAEYGSGYYKLEDNTPGTTEVGISQTVLSRDGRSVFIHIPQMAPAMQLEVKHAFKFADDGLETEGIAYFTVHQLRSLDLAQAGFDRVDLTRTKIVEASHVAEEASPELGRELAIQFGCAACHFPDTATGATIGPTWRNLYRSMRQFVDGTRTTANEDYLREKILDPQKRRLTAGVVEMPSYAGVLTDLQIDALIFYIRSLGENQAEGEK